MGCWAGCDPGSTVLGGNATAGRLMPTPIEGRLSDTCASQTSSVSNYELDELEAWQERTLCSATAVRDRARTTLHCRSRGSYQGVLAVHRVPSGSDVHVVLTENAARLVPLGNLDPRFVAAYMSSQMVQAAGRSQIRVLEAGLQTLAIFQHCTQFTGVWPSTGGTGQNCRSAPMRLTFGIESESQAAKGNESRRSWG